MAYSGSIKVHLRNAYKKIRMSIGEVCTHFLHSGVEKIAFPLKSYISVEGNEDELPC